MAGMRIRLDSAGMAALLKSAPVAAAVEGVASSIGARLEGAVDAHSGGPVPIDVTTYTTDRAAAAVTMAHPGALGIEAVHGPLARAAASQGFPVKAKRS